MGEPDRNSQPSPPQESAPAVPNRGADISGADLWQRGCRLIVMLILFLVPTLYPLRLPDGILEYLRSISYGPFVWFYDSQIDAFINFQYSPLPFKEAVFRALVMALLLFWLLRELTTTPAAAGRRGPRFDWRLYGPIAGLLAWSALSLLWSPTFYYSLSTFAMLAVGVLWFGIVQQIPKSRRVLRRWFNTILLAGGVVAFFAFLQDVDTGRRVVGLLFQDIMRAAAREPILLRLRMGSLIGHNIGVASFTAFSWFIVWTRLFQPGPLKRRIAWGAYLAFLAYVLVSLQTRGIWLTLLLLTPIHFVWLIRLTGKRWDLKPLLAAVLIVLIILTLQLIPSPRNPFYSPEAPLLMRFTHFTPEHLMTETRLRILVCSGSLVAENPLLGSGLGSFQYVFPQAQADYFAAHPDTFIAPSPHRTMRAHNDWLQLIIELGIPGVLLVLAGFYFALRRGWDSWRRIQSRTLQVELTAALMGVAAVAVHAFVNFPLHVVSTAVPAVFLLAVWTSCGSIGRTEATAPRPVPMPGKGAPAPRSSLAWIAAGAFFPVLLAATAFLYSILHASMYESIGTSYRMYYGDRFAELDDAQRHYTLGAAYQAFMEGHKRVPLAPELTYRLGEISVLRGVLGYIEAKEHGQSDEATSLSISTKGMQTETWLRSGIHWLQECQDEVKYHEVFHYLGMAHEHLFKMLRGADEREMHRQKAKQYYSLAVRYSPAFARSAYRLFELLQYDRPLDPARLAWTTRLIAKYDPALFHRQFIEEVTQKVDRRMYREAFVQNEVLIDAQPDNPDHWIRKVHLLSLTGRGAEALQLLDRIVTRIFPEIAGQQVLSQRMEAALAAGDYEQAASLALTVKVLPGGEYIEPYADVIRTVALEKTNQPEAEGLWKEIEDLGRTDPRYWTAAAEVFLYLAPDTDRAYQYAVRAARATPPPDGALLRIAAEMSWERGDKSQALDFLEHALERDPEDPRALQLLQTWEP